MPKYTVIYDACVLYPTTVRNLLMHLATSYLFKAKWSHQIHEEWMRNLHQDRPELTMETLAQIRDRMDSYVLDGLVTNFEPLIEVLSLPDEGDRHVLAAAIVGRADAIITFNLKDFPASALQPYGIEATHPDDFICAQLDLNMNLVCQCAKTQRKSMRKPPRTIEEYLKLLKKVGLPKTAVRFRELQDSL